EWWCRNFILPDICKPCLFVFLRNLFYLTFQLEAVQGFSVLPFWLTSFFENGYKKRPPTFRTLRPVNGLFFGIRLLYSVR
ncbi:hypothetical protein, partial [Flavonifractor plautii]|uniref:hypothetical protein n=1 Tax=Flavonifractor plautii TaxID=292800 RepID=UPI0022E44031